MRRHLLREGHTAVNNRCFAPPDGGPIKVLTKQCRYGAPLRQGKKGDDAGTGGKRVAYLNTHNRSGGTIVSC